MRKKSEKRQDETPPISPPLLFGAIATANRHLLDRKLLFDFKKPFDLIPNYISTTARRNAAPKNSIQQKFPTEIDKNCRLLQTHRDEKSPIITGIDKISTFSVGGKIPPDFLSKNRLNRHSLSIAINKKRQKKSPEKSFQGLNSISSVFVENSESKKWWGLLNAARTFFENDAAEINP